MKYEIKFPSERIENKFYKNLSKIHQPKIQDNIMERIEQLADNPRPEGKSFKTLKPPIEIYQYAADCRLRIGNYRVLYDINDEKKTVWILHLRKRDEKTYR
ncbi:MAG: type II toxin-antitoxin system RelE/ParE family toxin [bacterium]